VSLVQRLVFLPTNQMYLTWVTGRLVFSLVEFILYLHGAAHGFPEDKITKSILGVSQVVFLVDIVLNFLRARKKEGDTDEYITDFTLNSKTYLDTQFTRDLCLTLPLGFLGMQINPYFRILHLIKALRVQEIHNFFDPKFIMPYIRNLYQKKMEKIMKDPELSSNLYVQNNFIDEKLWAGNYLQISLLVLNIAILVYFSGSLWYLYVDFFNEGDLIDFISYYNLGENSGMRNFIVSSYFSFTTLSTVGFGDFCPRSNSERIFGSLFLLMGCAVYSYVGGNF